VLLDAEQIAFLAIIAAGSFLQAVTGFGFALVVVPPSLVFVDRLTVVTALNLLSPALNVLLLRRIQAPVETRLVRLFLPFAFAGMPLGVLALHLVPIGPFKVLAGALAIGFGLLMTAGRLAIPQGPSAVATTGLISGALQTSTTLSGPPIVMLLLAGNRAPLAVRRTLATMFLSMSLPTVVLLAATGSLTGEGLVSAAVGLPVALASGYVGDRASRRVPREWFRVVSLGVILVAGGISVVSGLL
jgi:uncharacterized membrane protein YfcA